MRFVVVVVLFGGKKRKREASVFFGVVDFVRGAGSGAMKRARERGG